MTRPMFAQEPGWFGTFSRNEAPGAIPNGARVRKSAEDPGDATPLGTEGSVLGSLTHPELSHPFYFIEWDDKPRVAIGTAGWKLEQVFNG